MLMRLGLFEFLLERFRFGDSFLESVEELSLWWRQSLGVFELAIIMNDLGR